MPKPERLSEQLRTALRRSGRTMASIAQATGISESALSRFLNGKHALPQAAWDAVGECLELQFARSNGRKTFTYGSVCSGIGGCSCAFDPLGWRCRWFYEIDPFACKVLHHHYPEVPNYGDATKNADEATSVDLVVAGTPCPSFSITGKRKGLADPRGKIAFAFTEIVERTKPRWIVWENVDGVRTSNQGRDFALFLHTLGELGLWWAFRVLDVSTFGVAQRRRRVFVVGHRGGCGPALAALAIRPQRRTDSAPVDEIQEEGLARAYGDGDGWSGDETPKRQVGILPTLRATHGGEGVGIAQNGRLRKLTAVEMERCQGFPDGWTDVAGATYGQRKKVLGNAFCVPAVRWIGERIAAIESSSVGRNRKPPKSRTKA